MTRTVPSTAAARVSVSGLSAGYGGEAAYPERLGSASTDAGRSTATLVIDEVSFDLLAGRCLAVVGRSGCGKSTLLHVLAGLHAPAAGEVCDRRRPRRGGGLGRYTIAQAATPATLRTCCSRICCCRGRRRSATRPSRAAWRLAEGEEEGRAASAQPAPPSRVRNSTTAPVSSCGSSASATPLRRGRPSSRGGCASASRWRARCSWTAASCCSTSRSGVSTPSPGRRCTAGCSDVMAAHPATWVLVTHDVDEAVLLGDQRRRAPRPSGSPGGLDRRGSVQARPPARRRRSRRRTRLG